MPLECLVEDDLMGCAVSFGILATPFVVILGTLVWLGVVVRGKARLNSKENG